MIYDKDNIEFRLAESPLCDESTVYGRAIAFDTPSDNLAQFKEIIRKGAVTQELLNQSDIYARVNHDDNYIMARCNHGKGSLKLELRDDGLYYSFTIPETEKGRELREHIRRGEIAHSSFAYWSSDKNVRLEKRNGEVYRIVEKIDYLVDVSPVYFPAYNSSSCSVRCAEQIEKFIKESEETENREGSVDNNAQVEEPTTTNQEEVSEPIENQNDTNNDGTPSDSDGNSNTVNREGELETQIEENGNSSDSGVDGLGVDDGAGGITEPIENQDDNTNNNDEAIDTRGGSCSNVNGAQDGVAENPETTDNSTNNSEYNERNININIMKKNYRLIDAIASVVANKPLDNVSEAVNRAGVKNMTESGLSYTGSIVLPTNVREGEVTVATEGEDLVPVEVWNIIPALKAKLLASKLGATILTGLSSDLVLPVGGKGNADWTDEIGDADDAGVTFSSVKLQPKRISTFIDISKKLLIQSGPDVEAYIRQEIVDAIAQKLEATIFSDDAATTKSPAGLLYGVTPTAIADFEDICELEADLDDANVADDRKYAVSNKAKAALRTMTKGSSLQLVWESESIDGTPAYNSSNIGTDKLVIYGDWKNLVIGQFGGLEVVTDTVTQARKGMIRLVVNFYVDFAIARPEAFVVGEIGE